MIVLDQDGVLDSDDLPPEVLDIKESPESSAEGPAELLGRPLKDVERWAIEETLKMTNGAREEAARILGIGVRTLYRRLDEYAAQDSE